MLGCSWKNNHGLIRGSGVSLKKVKKVFDKHFDVIEDFYADLSFVPDEFKGSKEDEEMREIELQGGTFDKSAGITLDDFVDLYAN